MELFFKKTLSPKDDIKSDNKDDQLNKNLDKAKIYDKIAYFISQNAVNNNDYCAKKSLFKFL